MQRAVLVLAFVLSGFATAAAQTAVDGQAPLAGPTVEIIEAPGVAMGFGGGGGPMMQERADFRLYTMILRDLDLSDEQALAIRLIHREYQEAVRRYTEEHDGELARLRRAVRRAAAGAMMDESADAEARRAAEAATTRIREIRQNQPPQEPYLLRVWETLTAQQQERFRERAEAMRREMLERTMEQRQERRRATAREAGVEGAPRPMIAEELTPEQRRRFERAVRERAMEQRRARENQPRRLSHRDVVFEEESAELEPQMNTGGHR